MEKPRWICPSCMDIMSSTAEECKLCQVTFAACQISVRGSAATVFKQAEVLFFEIIECKLSNTPAIPQSLQSSVDSFLNSEDLKKLMSANWRIETPMRTLFKCALRGDKSIAFETGEKIDTNSAGLFTVLVDALNGRLRLKKELCPELIVPKVSRPCLFWVCPNCENRYGSKKQDCSLCIIPKKVVVLSQRGNIASILTQTLELVISCVQLHSMPRSPGRKNEVTSLRTSIAALLESTSMASLMSSNWRLKDAIGHLLECSLTGREKVIPFRSSSWMDTNSTAVYLILVDRINDRLAELKAIYPTIDYSLERPVIERFKDDHWNCPSCQRAVAHDKKTCPLCNISKGVITICRQGLAAPVLNATCKLFMSCVEVHSGAWQRPESREERLNSLKTDIDGLISGEPMSSLVSSNWRIRDAVQHLLNSVLVGENRVISFCSSSWMDTNSKAIYVILVDHINNRLAGLEPSSGFEVEKPHIAKFDDHHWKCPNCQKSILHKTEHCPACGIHKRVYLLASGSTITNAERLFMSCVEVQCGAWKGPECKEERLNSLKTDIDELVDGDDMASLVVSKWRIREAIGNMLRSAHGGETRLIPFQSSSMIDTNSVALYIILVDKINSKLDDMQLSTRYRVERPVLFSFAEDYWKCPNCDQESVHEKETCRSCNIHKKVWQISQNPHTGPTFKKTYDLFMCCVEVHSGAWQGPESSEERLNIIKEEIDNLIGSEAMTSMMTSKWRLKSAINHVLRSVLCGQPRIITFKSSTWMDINSKAIFLILVNRINAGLCKLEPRTDFVVERPVIPCMGDHWICPNCHTSIRPERDICQSCNINKKVLQMANISQTGPVLQNVEVLFMSCVEVHSGAWQGPESREERLNALKTEIDELVDGDDMRSIENSKWRIKNSISHLLRSVLSGEDRIITFECSKAIDSNSKGIYMLLADRINACLEKLSPNTGFWVKRPTIYLRSSIDISN